MTIKNAFEPPHTFQLYAGQVQLVSAGELVNVFPKRGSRLSFQVPAFTASGNFDQILRNASLDKRFPDVEYNGHVPPPVSIAFPGGTGRDLLNEFVRQRDRNAYTWRCGTDLTFPGCAQKERIIVDMVFDVKRGEPKIVPPTPRTAVYRYKYVVEGGRKNPMQRLTVQRVPVDPVRRQIQIEVAARDLPGFGGLVLERYVTFVRAILKEEILALREYVHPDGVRRGEQRLTWNEYLTHWRTAFETRDYTQFEVGDVLDLDKIEVQNLTPAFLAPGARYRVSAKPKITTLDKERYFDKELWFIFEHHSNGRWYIVESN